MFPLLLGSAETLIREGRKLYTVFQLPISWETFVPKIIKSQRQILQLQQEMLGIFVWDMVYMSLNFSCQYLQ